MIAGPYKGYAGSYYMARFKCFQLYLFSDTDCFGVNSARRPGGVKHFNNEEINWKHQMCIASANNKDFLFLEAMRDANLIQIIDVPTRGWWNDTPAALHLLLTNDDAVVKDIKINESLDNSDHALISAKIVCQLVT